MIRNAFLVLIFLAAPLRLFAHEDLHEQIEIVSKELQAEPESGALYFRRAELYRTHEDWALALKDYARAEELKAESTPVRLGRGKLLIATGDARNACIELDAVIESSPAHVDARCLRARARAIAGDSSGAVDDYSAAINASPHPEPELFTERAALLVASHPPQFAEALSGLEHGIARLGSPITLVLAAFDIELKSRQFEAALDRINRAAVGVKRSEQWHVRRAEVLELAGRHPEAVLAWAQALAAVESLPPRYRQVESTVKLEGRIRQALSASNGNPARPAAEH